jgi:hypothetical protein
MGNMNYLEAIQNDAQLENHLELLCDFRIDKEFGELDPKYIYTKNPFCIFGRDASGGEFGFIGNGEIKSLSIGYVSSDGQAGRVAKNLSDFFHLITFYPYWHDLFYTDIEDTDAIQELEQGYRKDFTKYDEMQKYIVEKLHLTESLGILKNLYSALTIKPKFVVYAAIDNEKFDDLLM